MLPKVAVLEEKIKADLISGARLKTHGIKPPTFFNPSEILDLGSIFQLHQFYRDHTMTRLCPLLCLSQGLDQMGAYLRVRRSIGQFGSFYSDPSPPNLPTPSFPSFGANGHNKGSGRLTPFLIRQSCLFQINDSLPQGLCFFAIIFEHDLLRGHWALGALGDLWVPGCCEKSRDQI